MILLCLVPGFDLRPCVDSSAAALELLMVDAR